MATVSQFGSSGNTRLDVLRLIFERGALEQVAAARLLGVTKAASNLHFQKLIAEGYLTPAPGNASGRGRPAQQWHIDDSNRFLGFVLERGSILMELMDFSGSCRLRSSRALEADSSVSAIGEAMSGLLKDALAVPGTIRQIFVAVPGGIAADGTIVNSPNLTCLNGWNPDRFFAEKGIAAYTDTIGMAVIQGETSAAGVDETSLLLEWSDGFGATFAVNGEPLIFSAPRAHRRRGLWDYSHMRVELNGRLCHCGRQGCLEAYVGGVSLLELHPELHCASVEAFADLLASGDETARSVFGDAVRRVAPLLYHELELFGVEHVVLAGKLREAFPIFAELFREELRRFYPPEELSMIALHQGGDPYLTLSHGAALTARNYFLNPDKVSRFRGVGQSIVVKNS